MTALSLLAGVGVVLGRRVVMPGRKRTVQVLSATPDSVTLPATPETLHDGEYGFWFDSDRGHALVGRILHHDTIERTVRREVLRVTGGDLAAADEGRWTGHVFARPEDIDPRVREIHVDSPTGPCPAWLFPSTGGEGGTTWAIHVHGIRTTRITALRSVPAARKLGYTSLVPSFRGDGDGPSTKNGVSTLGQTESDDVDAAINYAVEHGAHSIVLFGWSLGGGIALQLSERSPHRHLIAALVLIAPATDWRQVIQAGARRAHLPSVVGALGTFALSTRSLSALVGLPRPIDFDALDWTRGPRLTVPTLLIHSDGDREVPASLSRAFVSVNAERSELALLPPAAHAWEYNVAPDEFDASICEWIGRRRALS
ncbi:alpha/beta fold hydrolase [Rathayibacter sp. VKM Ac-2929]|uniref:alpha/beta hydrolase family protein n=1 Tax=Rathayibacter sp. VKM Ac-2929 TaxID=2929480 RepID=UPI001FB534EA|nr:alpha/beta fold hydrolase [Rathayibacter sp. VKM Ac-2929]MCJ1675446.1 alpha/beta fold hydrolase [Rathayibacter sp. VKM Ac-2929]